MSHNSEEVQSKLGEKKQLQKEEEALKKLIEQIKRQISALQVILIVVFRNEKTIYLQVEELEISSRLPVARFTPFQTSIPTSPPQQTENLIPEINLDILGGQPVYQGEVEEEDEDEEL